jgi:hypothetical protein
MNSQQVQDIRLMYEAVYNDELREKADEYNNEVNDGDIVEVATEYFYNYGLNEDGINILIEKVGLENFVEFVYDLSEDLYVLTEARRAKKRTGGKSYEQLKKEIYAKDEAKKSAKKKVTAAAQERKQSETKKPETQGADTEAKRQQSKSKKPERSGIARAISGAVERAKRDTELLKKSFKTAREVGREHETRVARAAGTAAGVAHGAVKVAQRLGQEAGKSETGQKIKKALGVNEEADFFDYILEYLIAEGYADTNESALNIMANMSRENLEETKLGWAARAIEKREAQKGGLRRTRSKKEIQASRLGSAQLLDKNATLEKQKATGDTGLHKGAERPKGEDEYDDEAPRRRRTDRDDHPSLTARERNPSMR